MRGLCRIVHSALGIQAFRAPLSYFEENERKPHWWKCSGTAPQQATTVPLCMKGRNIKDKMDFWGRAKNKGNKSADHEGMTRLVSAEGAGRKGEGNNGTPGQMTCWRIEKSTQEVSSQFTKPTRAWVTVSWPWLPRGGRDCNSPTLFFPTFFPKSFPFLANNLAEGRGRLRRMF